MLTSTENSRRAAKVTKLALQDISSEIVLASEKDISRPETVTNFQSLSEAYRLDILSNMLVTGGWKGCFQYQSDGFNIKTPRKN